MRGSVLALPGLPIVESSPLLVELEIPKGALESEASASP